MLKTAIINMRAVVVIVSVIRGQGLLAMIPDDLRTQSQDVDPDLLHCWSGKSDQSTGCKSSTVHMEVGPFGP